MCPTPVSPCSACGAFTVLHRDNLYPVTLVAAVLDCVLRLHQQPTATPSPPWSQLASLIEQVPDISKELDQCKAQAHTLSGLIQRNWLGPFDQLCLSCGVIAFAEEDGQEDAVEADTPPEA